MLPLAQGLPRFGNQEAQPEGKLKLQVRDSGFILAVPQAGRPSLRFLCCHNVVSAVCSRNPPKANPWPSGKAQYP